MNSETYFAKSRRAARLHSQVTLLIVALTIFIIPRAWAVVLGPSTTPIPGVDTGELLLGELNCVACHRAESTVKERLQPRQGPILGPGGISLTPHFLRDFISNAESAKLGTPMPNLLHSLPPERARENADALAHFLVSLESSQATAEPTGADLFKIQQGKTLFHQVGCVACHAPQEAVAALYPQKAAAGGVSQKEDDLQGLQKNSVPLDNLARKFAVPVLAQFLIDPLKSRPSGRMPSLSLNENEATAIAMYLLRDQVPGLNDPSVPLQKVRGIAYQYFEAGFNADAPNFDALKPKTSGFVDRFDISSRRRNGNFGFRFTGVLRIDSPGEYTFYTESDDGSRVTIGDKLVVKNDGHHPMTEASGAIQLAAGDQPIAVTYFNGGGEFGLKVSYKGPGFSKKEIPAEALSHLGQPMAPLGNQPFVVDAEKARRGKELFGSLRCAACHAVRGVEIANTLNAPALERLDATKVDGCLGERVRAGLPLYALTEAQRVELKKSLAHREQYTQALTAKEQVARTMAALNCFACHSRDGAGGPESRRAEYFVSVGDVDLGDEGRMPPHLTRVGDKLRSDWLREVLVNHGTVRPYMAARMPQFGKDNVQHLVDAFEKADGSFPHEPGVKTTSTASAKRLSKAASPDAVERVPTPLVQGFNVRTLPGDSQPEYATEISARDAKFGRKLVGRDGLTCIACHTFAQYKSLGVPAMDLTQMTRRLKKDWFRRYLIEPASLRPGTRMPPFWPDSKAVNQEILDGDTERQVNAIWAFLSKGREAEVPHGLVQAKMELAAEKEAIIYRNFIAGAGPRGIGVAYPEKANLAFDAQDLRWALIWQGAFIDASRHRTDRGAGFEPPLGDHVTKMPTGPAFAVLADTNAAWPEQAGKKAGYQMRGYRLDSQRRPAFLYSFKDIQIEDYPVAVAGELDPELKRTLTLRSEHPPENLWFRAAVGSSIEEKANGVFLVERKLSLRFQLSGGKKPVIRQSGDRWELLVPVVFERNEARVVEQIAW